MRNPKSVLSNIYMPPANGVTLGFFLTRRVVNAANNSHLPCNNRIGMFKSHKQRPLLCTKFAQKFSAENVLHVHNPCSPQIHSVCALLHTCSCICLNDNKMQHSNVIYH